MSLQIKICGIRDAVTARAAVDAGADLLGFVFHPPSPRHLHAAQAAGIAATLPAEVEVVAVMLHPVQALVDEVCSVLRPHWLQTDASDLQALRLPAGCRPLPVYRRGAAVPGSPPARLLFESERSGAGDRADWDAAAALARRCELLLAGGLDRRNVAEAIERVHPHGVDVSSGVERAPGLKDPQRIAAFIAAARAAASRAGDYA